MARKKIRMEFVLHASTNLVYPYLSSAGGLSQWFCSDVDTRLDYFTFKWETDSQKAKVLKKVLNKSIKFQWDGSAQDEYFEFELERDAITDGLALIVTDFTEEAEEKESRMLWDSQVHDLKSCIGA